MPRRAAATGKISVAEGTNQTPQKCRSRQKSGETGEQTTIWLQVDTAMGPREEQEGCDGNETIPGKGGDNDQGRAQRDARGTTETQEPEDGTTKGAYDGLSQLLCSHIIIDYQNNDASLEVWTLNFKEVPRYSLEDVLPSHDKSKGGTDAAVHREGPRRTLCGLSLEHR